MGFTPAERFLRLLGEGVARRPWLTIILSLVAAGIASLGIIAIHKEGSPVKLWVPTSSRFYRDTEWLTSRVVSLVRPQRVLAHSTDVTQPDVLAALAQLYENVDDVKRGGISYEDVCLRVPVVAQTRFRRDNSIFDDDIFDDNQPAAVSPKPFDPSIDLDSKIYCGILNSFPSKCLHFSILDLWKFNRNTIGNLSHDEIIETLNNTNVSPTLGHSLDYTKSLGGIKRDENGTIVSAEAVLLTWYVSVSNFTDGTYNDAGTEEWSSEETYQWEGGFIDVLEERSHNVTNFTLTYEAGRSFGDASGSTMFRDVDKLVIGIILMSVYIQLILSRFNWLEFRLTLGSVGLLCVGLALVTSVGICALIGLPYGPIHNSLPFLLMGLGIDDIFVMKSCWENLSESEMKLPLPERIGLMLQHAGTSILVTSFTDIVAFLVGSITILPSLQSFCLYAAVGVFMIFVFTVTFYVAIFTLDQKRIDAKRNGLLICIRHPDHPTPKVHRKPMSHYVMRQFYTKFVFLKPVKIFIILFTLLVTCWSIVGVFNLEQKFDAAWFIPKDSYYSKFLTMRNKYFPHMGYEGMVLIGALNYSSELGKIWAMSSVLKNQTEIMDSYDSWIDPFDTYVQTHFDKSIESDDLTETEWRTYLSKFLFSPSGSKYRSKFHFDTKLECGKPASNITVSIIDFTYKALSDPKIYLPAKHKLKDIVDGANFTTGEKFATVWSKIYANWETDEVIKTEVERNIGLALVCVLVSTLILIRNFHICFWIFVCVSLTLINVCGWMQKWGLTIDIITCVGLELGVGFCVDYAAHIGHMFLTLDGTRHERALNTVSSIGAAVVYGGGSTLLSLSVLIFSETYVFKTFFKIFFLVITFGLFNGLMFLPVILSLIGPKPYKKYRNRPASPHNIEELQVVELNDMK